MATLITPRPQPEYRCTQAELYSGLNSAWDSQAEREAEFIAENTKYTAGMSVVKKAAIQAAKVLPDGQARYAASEVMHADLEELLDGCLGKWNSLDGYIRKAFKGAHYKPRIEEAGKGYYDSAANKDWEDVSLLLEAGKTFITTHSAVLEAEGGMPTTPSFADAYNDVKEEFDELYGNFKDARQDAQEQTDAKIEANNAIYREGREMMEDGKHIFRKNASVRERFVWERILAMLSPEEGEGLTEVKEGDIAATSTASTSLAGLGITDDTRVKVELDGEVVIFGSNVPQAVPGPGDTFWNAPAGTVTKPVLEFTTLTGLSEMKPVMNIRNNGTGVVHYKVTFTHLESPTP